LRIQNQYSLGKSLKYNEEFYRFISSELLRQALKS